MSFVNYRERIREKDTVIVCRGYEKMFPTVVERGKVIQIKGGAIHHDSFIGREFGSKVETSNGKNWVLVLHPTPELWTLSLPHRTQIIYSTDSAFITLALGLRPGSKVIESGTGSGALSHAIARTVAPHGHLYTFEFHQQRADLAQQEFEHHGLGDVVTLVCRDVCNEGFGLVNAVDAVFLDLPKPWEALQSAKTSLKCGGSSKVCSFSPCMEQVQRTCETLRTLGFSDVEVVECVHQPYELKPQVLVVPDTGLTRERRQEGEGPGGGNTGKSHSLGSASLLAAQAVKRIPGHTGYLTSATLFKSSSIQ